MKAVVMNEAGGPEVLQLQDVAEPEISAPNHIKVQIKAAGVNPVDTKQRRNGVFLPDGLPAILGCDGAGVVVEVGQNVSDLQVGDQVWFCSGGLGGMLGNYAEYTLVDQAACCKKPDSIDFPTAAAAPLVLLTAWEALFDRAHLQSGQTILIHGGAGGVGHVAIQLAKQAGARVITTVSSAAKADFVRGIGADEVINYRHSDFAEETNRMTNSRGADVVFDTVGPEVFRQSIEATAHYGDLVTILDPGMVEWKEARMRNLRVSFTLMLTPMLRGLQQQRQRQKDILQQCAALIDDGKLKISVNSTLNIKQSVEAHRLIEAGGMQGKIILAP